MKMFASILMVFYLLPGKTQSMDPHTSKKTASKLALLQQLCDYPTKPVIVCNVPAHLQEIITPEVARQTILSILPAISEVVPKKKGKSKKKAHDTTVRIDYAKLTHLRLPNPCPEGPAPCITLAQIKPKIVTLIHGTDTQESIDPHHALKYKAALQQAVTVSTRNTLLDVELTVDIVKLHTLLPRLKPTLIERITNPINLITLAALSALLYYGIQGKKYQAL